MAQKKKLQVFVSSTYTDLREERQAAVEAILTAGHIPAGMELFAAGDETQMNVIKRWIDESDVYLLILGGRYGSLEPKSQKSYIHLEYDYAIEKGKPFFAVVIDEEFAKERVKTHPLGVGAYETENAGKFKEFRAQVVSKMVRFWRDPKDIKLAILETMSEFSRREDSAGWIHGSEAVNSGALAEEIARLGKENAQLRDQLAKLPMASARYNGVTFEEMYKLLANTEVEIEDEEIIRMAAEVAEVFGDAKPGLLHMYWVMRALLGSGTRIASVDVAEIIRKAQELGLVRFDPGTRNYFSTDAGVQFLLRLRIELDATKAEKFVL